MFDVKFTVFAIMLASITFLVCLNYAEAQYVKDGLVGYWSFDKGTVEGSTVKDLSGNNYHGTANFPIKLVAGKIGEAIEFDGVNDHYVATKLMVTDKQYVSLTMMAWVKPYKAHDAWGSIMNGDDGGWDRGYGYRADAWEVQVGHGGDWQPGDLIDVNQWQHTVVIYTPNDVIFYKNGKITKFGKAATPTTSTQPLIFGDDIPCGPNCAINAAVDEALIYGRALSDDEVQQNFKAQGAAVVFNNVLAITWGDIKNSD